MGAPSSRPVTLDSGALIAIERGDERIRALLSLAAAYGGRIYVPTAVVAEVWRGGMGRQARLATFLNAGERFGHVEFVTLDLAGAKLIGLLLARAGVADGGVTDAMVAWCALRFDTRILTSDPEDIRRLVANERIERV